MIRLNGLRWIMRVFDGFTKTTSGQEAPPPPRPFVLER